MYALIYIFIKIKTKQEREKQLSFKHPLQNQWEERAIEICTFYLSYVFIFIHISGNIIYVKVISHLRKIVLYLFQAAFKSGVANRFYCHSDSKRLIAIYGWVCWNNFRVILESVVKNVIMGCVWGKCKLHLDLQTKNGNYYIILEFSLHSIILADDPIQLNT